MKGQVWRSYLGHNFRVERVWTENGIRWVGVVQIGGAFDGEWFKWCIESLLQGGMERVS